jgi:hypothetical protein
MKTVKKLFFQKIIKIGVRTYFIFLHSKIVLKFIACKDFLQISETYGFVQIPGV